MDIDSQIRDILARSFPVNDNQHCIKQTSEDDKSSASAIAVYGNNNVVIGIDSTSLMTFLFFLSILIAYFYR